MIARLIRAWRRAPVVLPLFVLALAATLFFGIRTLLFVIYWNDPAHHQQMPEPWMTPGSVAHSWGVPPDAVLAAFGLTPPLGKPMTLRDIARIQGLDEATVLETALAAAKAASEGPRP